MAYSDFTLAQVQETFDLAIEIFVQKLDAALTQQDRRIMITWSAVA
jgi:hypothetical protein